MTKKGKQRSALNIRSGVTESGPLSDHAIQKFKNQKRKTYSTGEYVEGIITGNRNILSQAITLLESTLPEHHHQAQQVLDTCLPHSGNSVRIGITGVPGVGKSTFIEVFGKFLTGQGHKIAVLAIDPSSEKSKGSIMGDKTRMALLAADENAFIRPSPSAGSLGGVAQKTRESIFLCEAAGFDIILIETVGVGQSETAVHSMVDFFLLLMLAGAGDELQGIKRGIMEMADLLAITKSDGANSEKASTAKMAYENALHLLPPAESGWPPKVVTCSALKNEGISEIWNTVSECINFTKTNDYFYKKRRTQAIYWMHESIMQQLKKSFYHNNDIMTDLKNYEKHVINDELSSFMAAEKLLQKYFDSFRE